MASTNPNAPFGFRLIRNENGDFPQISTRTASGSVAVSEGQIGYLRTDGTVAAYSGTYTLGRKLVGPIVVGVSASETDRTIKVCEDPRAEMEVMLDDASVTGINGLIGRNFRGANMSTVNGTLRQSVASLDASTGSSLNGALSTNLRPFQAIRFSREVGNDSSQSFARVIVRINSVNHIFGGATTTV